MKKSAKVLIVILIAAVIAVDIVYIVHGDFWQKILASVLFFILGIVNILACKDRFDARTKRFAAFLLAGLLFSMIGDILLNIVFIYGAAFFGVAHIFYFISYCRLLPFRGKDLIAPALIFAAAVLTLTLVPAFDFGGTAMFVMAIVYALVISLMVGKALSNLIRHPGKLGIIVFVGSFLFLFSDVMLVFNFFGGAAEVFDTLCLATYYPAQCILALSVSASALLKNN